MRFLTAGESHGEALNAIISEFPSGVKIDTDFINYELARRQMGYGRGQRMSIEKDEIKILSGVKNLVSTGSPISLIIKNLDWQNWKTKPAEMEKILNPRPGHADLCGFLKYRLDDIRDVIERSSARETAARVAVGAFAKLFLRSFEIFVLSFVEQIGKIKIDYKLYSGLISKNFNPLKNKNDNYFLSKIESSFLRCPDENASEKMLELLNKTIKAGDTLGGSVRVISSGMIIGLGSFTQWDKRIDAKIASALMSIPSVKAISFGTDVYKVFKKGTEYHDEIFYNKELGFYRKKNNAGGIEGGMTNGENIEVQVFIKPIPTTTSGLKTVDIKTKKETISLKERSDICAVPSIAVISESMLAIELMNAIQDKFGNDNMDEIIANYNNYKKYLANV